MAVIQVAAGLGVSRKTLSLLLNGHAGMSPETLAPARSAGVAIRLSEAFGRTPEGWLQLQIHFATWPRSANESKASPPYS